MSAQAIQGVVTEIHHEPTLYAEPIFFISSFPVTNALLTSWLAVALIVIASIMLRRKLQRIPRGIQNYAEVILEAALSLADSVTGDRRRSMQFMPLVFSFFIFILLSNWLGILPGVGSIGFVHEDHGALSLVPLFRGVTADLNTTLALSLVAVIATHIFGVMLVGARHHWGRFFNIEALMQMPREIFKKRNFTAIIVSPIHFGVGIIEAVGELAKVASLSFRLFGNVFAGEVLLGAMAAIFAYALPIPFLMLEILVGLIQALIFAMLVLVFMTIMGTSHATEEHSH